MTTFLDLSKSLQSDKLHEAARELYNSPFGRELLSYRDFSDLMNLAKSQVWSENLVKILSYPLPKEGKPALLRLLSDPAFIHRYLFSIVQDEGRGYEVLDELVKTPSLQSLFQIRSTKVSKDLSLRMGYESIEQGQIEAKGRLLDIVEDIYQSHIYGKIGVPSGGHTRNPPAWLFDQLLESDWFLRLLRDPKEQGFAQALLERSGYSPAFQSVLQSPEWFQEKKSRNVEFAKNLERGLERAFSDSYFSYEIQQWLKTPDAAERASWVKDHFINFQSHPGLDSKSIAYLAKDKKWVERLGGRSVTAKAFNDLFTRIFVREDASLPPQYSSKFAFSEWTNKNDVDNFIFNLGVAPGDHVPTVHYEVEELPAVQKALLDELQTDRFNSFDMLFDKRIRLSERFQREIAVWRASRLDGKMPYERYIDHFRDSLTTDVRAELSSIRLRTYADGWMKIQNEGPRKRGALFLSWLKEAIQDSPGWVDLPAFQQSATDFLRIKELKHELYNYETLDVAAKKGLLALLSDAHSDYANVLKEALSLPEDERIQFLDAHPYISPCAQRVEKELRELLH